MIYKVLRVANPFAECLAPKFQIEKTELGYHTASQLAVLREIAFKQPVTQAEIDQLFTTDKRGLVVKLRDLRLVTDFAGEDGRLRFATTEAFLQRFGLASLAELGSMFSAPANLNQGPRGLV